jgi:hypothetical protein
MQFQQNNDRAAVRMGMVLFSLVLSGVLANDSQVYDNFEGAKILHYASRSGTLDTLSANPAPNEINRQGKCARYIRNSDKKFDNIKMSLTGKLTNVSNYATYVGIPPKIKMKIYTAAPVGTLVEILLGSKGRNNEYPAGTHSQYQAYTTVKDTWEELEFKFSQVPAGSETAATEIDQITLLFSPNSSSSDTYYFDDITGPPLETTQGATPEVQDSKTIRK